MNLLHTPQFDEALRLMREGGAFTFITGRAGTGKSTLLRHFCETSDTPAPVLAPTGVAALNVGGETIHRFFRFPPGITVRDARRKGAAADTDLYGSLEALIIDEISMVRADLLDCMDAFLRAARKEKFPFGGVRIIGIGDLYQLPPVVTTRDRDAFFAAYNSPYFFASEAFKQLQAAGEVSFIELETVYRQSDPKFIALLNAIRNRTATNNDLACLNARVQASAQAQDAIILTPTNDAADALNDVRLRRLSGKEQIFEADVHGKFPPGEAPTDERLCLKKGSRVMCVVNDPSSRFVNGSLGVVSGFEDGEENEIDVMVKLDDGETVRIAKHTWTLYRSVYDKKAKRLDQERMGSFCQIPLRLAWAVTIHKSQGKTFDRATIDLGRGAFAAGQVYVALSRCRSFEGLCLIKPVTLSQIHLDYSIVKFLSALQSGPAVCKLPLG